MAAAVGLAAKVGPADDQPADPLRLRYEAIATEMPEGFRAAIEPPFVVVSDAPEAELRRWCAGTIRWAVTRLKRSYFERDPEHVLTVWLFKDRDTYEAHVEKLWGRRPTTPYGYYSPSERVLVMNIATGGGTLVHEILHPFMAANFPRCPAWFNEGLGSLYEQSSERDGEIVGLTNWRLAGLQKAIEEDRLPTFETLLATSNGSFYTDERGTNYAQARYLCLYLQERGLLRRFYREFVAAQADDPTGVGTLRAVLGRDDLDAFKDEWERWVLTLRFP